MTTLYEESAYYVTCGLSVLPVSADGSKSPDGRVLPFEKDPTTGEQLSTWKPFQFHHPDDMYLRRWFDCQKAANMERGVGIIGGKVSNNLEIMDFDEAGIFDEFWQIVVDNELDHYFDRAPVVATPSGGKHLYYYVDGAACVNDKLARAANRKTRIETKGEGGYVVAPPSGGKVHQSGGSYRLESGSFSYIPVVPADVVKAVHGFARLFNLYIEPEKQPVRETVSVHEAGELKPGEDFNRRGSIEDLLIEAGWRCTATRRNGAQMWARPEKTGKATSATLHAVAPNIFYVFSSNAAPFETEHGYDPFGVYCLLRHDGDYKAAVAQLGKDGYGISEEVFAERIETKKKEQRVSVLDAFDIVPDATLQSEPTILLGRHELTDTGNAKRFVRQWKDELRYDHSLKSWYVWNGEIWEIDRTCTALERAKKTATRIYAEAGVDGLDGAVRESIIKHAKATLAAGKLEAMMSLSKSDPAVAVVHDIWDSNPWLLNVKNGTLDLRTGTFREHRREDLMTHLAGVKYDPDAKCPTWFKCLEQWQPSAEVREFLKRAVGYSLTGSSQEQKLIYLYGSGANGKSVFLETCRFIIGDYWVKARADSFMRQPKQSASAAQPDLVALIGKRFVTTSEVAQSEKLNESLVKDITGGDTFAVRDLYRGMVNFKPQCKLWFFGNHKPRIDSDDGGIWRRFLLVNFGTVIPVEDRDPHLIDKLFTESSGILNWALEGCRQWQASGLTMPKEINNATAEYRQAEDVVGRFINEVVIESAGTSISSSLLYAAYSTWCKVTGERPVSAMKFSDAIKNKGIKKERVSAGVRFIGITARSDQEIREGQ